MNLGNLFFILWGMLIFGLIGFAIWLLWWRKYGKAEVA